MHDTRKTKVRYPIMAFLLLFTWSAFLLSGCKAKEPEPISRTGILLDTVITIQIYDSKDTALLDDAFDLCRSYEQKFSRTIKGSEVDRINQADGAFVEVSEETAALIEKALYYCALSEGAFDITTAPLSDLWDFKHNTGTLPSPEAISEALSHVGYETIEINGSSVRLADPDAAIDLGGIAKGYIADQIKALLQEKGVTSAVINLGGNVITIGHKGNSDSFHIGIQKPFGAQNEVLTVVPLDDRSLVSSGNYERYFEKDGTIYHHILNPETGYPTDSGLNGVTILSDHSVDGDALSTTCFSLGLEKGMDLIEQLDGVEALFIESDGTIHYSEGFPQ